MKDTGWTFQGYRVFESENAPNPIGSRHIGTHKERTMTTNHIDQLAQWYADAEQITKANLPRAGDTLILPYNAGGYGVEVEEDGWTPDDVVRGEPVRILARAPKPKPAWHDAVAVIATRNRDSGYVRGVWANVGGGRWHGVNGGIVNADDLTDVTPLIEAKVTDAMIDRILDVIDARFDNYPAGIGEDLAVAALGLETE